MPEFPTPWTVKHQKRTSIENDIGEQVDALADPVDVDVYGWAPPSPDAELRDLGTGVKRDIDLYAPEAFTAPKDIVILEGVSFEVVGWPEDYMHGPFGYRPGYRINLNRAEG